MTPSQRSGCPDCGGMGFVGYDVDPAHPMFGRVKPCENSAFHGAERLQRAAALSGLMAGDLERRLADIKPMPGNKPMLEAARKMISNPYGWLYIHGGPGNAKSEILIAIVNELNASGQGPALYIKFSRLIEWMRDAFTEKANRDRQLAQGRGFYDLENLGYLDRFERIKSIRCLALDEIDKARMTEFAEEFRFDFFDERYRLGVYGQAVTLFASQTPPEVMPEPLVSRFRDGRFRVVENGAADARPGMRRAEGGLRWHD